jgi:DNA-binding response OmpR family regulator
VNALPPEILGQKERVKILVIERDLLLRRLYKEELSEWGYEPIVLSRGDPLLNPLP